MAEVDDRANRVSGAVPAPVLAGLVIALLVSISRPAPLRAQTPPETAVETACCTVRYSDPDDLARFSRRLRVSYLGPLLDWQALRAADPLRRLDTKLSAVMARVEKLLGMPDHGFRPVIRLVPDRHSAVAEWTLSYPGTKPPKAWFLPAEGVIVLSMPDLNAHVLAHELTHALVHDAFDRRVPEEIHEILARHVDRHLRDD